MTLWQIRLSQDAKVDVADILSHTLSRYGEGQLRVYQHLVAEALDSLTQGPLVLRSKAREDIMPGLRSLHVGRRGRPGRHVIMYRATDEQVIDVFRILHDAMDIARHLPTGM